MVLKAMRRVFVQILQGVVGLSCLLLLLFYWQQHQQQEYETFLPWTSCSGPPPVPFQHKPNIIVLTIDSWRKDTVGTDSMPQTLKWLGEGTHLEWKHHDSCAVQSDQGYVALHYGRTGLKREAIRQYKHSSRIKSWLLQAIRDNGYTMHKVTPEYYSFCWLLMEECDLYTRDYGYQNGYNKTTMRSLPKEAIFGGGGSEIVFDTMEKLLQEQARTNGSPIFVSADLQNLHHPLRYEGRAHLNHSYHHPAISDKEVHLTYSGGIQITEDNKANLVQKLRNRVKNCLLELDDDLAAFLKAAQPYLNNTLLVLTGDHSELLFDTEENFIWHGVNHPIDLQRQVPMFLYGPNSIVSKLQVPDGIVTGHTDVLPSILEALAGQPLDPRWKEELDYHSYWNYHQQDDATTHRGFAYHSLHEHQVLIQGNQRVALRSGVVLEAHLLNNTTATLPSNEILEMAEKMNAIEARTWPGWNSDHCNITTSSQLYQ